LNILCRVMRYNSKAHHRRSIRLKQYDYSQIGVYFVTICTYHRDCLFGKIINGEIILNEIGLLVQNEWVKTEKIRDNILIDVYLVMPNHLHGIIMINNVGAYSHTPLQNVFRSTSKTIGAIIRGFKSTTTKQINQYRQNPYLPVWQRNYYEHIIRNEDELSHIREYILNNPLQWEYDRENIFRISNKANQWQVLEEIIYGIGISKKF